MYAFGNGEGPGSNRTFNINVTDDEEVENVETITLTGNTTSPLAVFSPRTAIVEILNSDGKFLLATRVVSCCV